MSIPIVRAGKEEIIGFCISNEEANSIDVRFVEGANVTKKEFFKMFGGARLVTDLEADANGETDFENYIIKRAKIHSFRLEPA